MWLVLAVQLVAAGCSSDEPVNYPPPGDGVVLDGINWPDYGPFNPYDYGPFKFDTGTVPGDGSAVDGAVSDATGDGSGGCPGPAGANCSPACVGGDLCTEAEGGKCAPVYVLTGPASDEAVLLKVALAYAECWSKQPSVDTLCATFDTCNMTGTLDDQMVKTWVCDTAQVSDFPNSATFDTAQNVCGCAWYQTYRPDWRISSINPGKNGDVCVSYDVISWWPDALVVDYCKNFPPQ